MSQIIYIQYRNNAPKELNTKIYKICKLLEPDNILPISPIVHVDGNTAYGVINPVNTIKIKNNSVVMGHTLTNHNSIFCPLGEIPDGSFAIYRSDEIYMEVITDVVASRTVWYYFDESLFVASSSQRAIVLFLDSFEFNVKVIPWMLSNGITGPFYSWDKRIKGLKSNSSILLRKDHWQIERSTSTTTFKKVKRPLKKHKQLLIDSIESSFQKFNVDMSEIVLPLSGGYDSRGILFFMLKSGVKKNSIHTITWGRPEALKEVESDAYVAKKIAEQLEVKNKYYYTEKSDVPLKTVIRRFIEYGEGRIDHISGYLDGFNIWKTLFEDGIKGIIRGDEAFGAWSCKSSPKLVRFWMGCLKCDDYSNFKDYEYYKIPHHEFPSFLKQKKDESISTWRDRLYLDYRLPNFLAALSNLKLNYIEQLTPLLTKEIIDLVRSLPDNLRTNKKLFKSVVNSFKPKYPYAKKPATSMPKDILKSPELMKVIMDELNTDYAKLIFTENFINKVLKSIKLDSVNSQKSTIKKKIITSIKNYVPSSFKTLILAKKKIVLDPNLLAFRVYIIIYMHKLLTLKH